jgi:hypothetical protein
LKSRLRLLALLLGNGKAWAQGLSALRCRTDMGRDGGHRPEEGLSGQEARRGVWLSGRALAWYAGSHGFHPCN